MNLFFSMQKPILFLIDLDNTLLNNDLIKNEIKRSLTQVLGSAEAEHFWKHHDDFRNKHNLVNFPYIIRKYCSEKHKDTCDFTLESIFKKIDFQKALYPKAKEVIVYLKKFGKVILFTEGDPVYQKMKIEKSTIGSMVDVILLFPHKLEHLDQIVKKYKDYDIEVIDDRSTTLMTIKNKYPQIHIIEVCQGHYSTVDHKAHPVLDKTIESISELLNDTFDRKL